MKTILQILTLIFIINLNSFAQSVDLQKGLVAYFPFDGNAVDETGSGVYGIVNGATLTSDRNGKPNAAYKFANNDDYIKIPLTSKNFESDYSISCWVSFDNFSINYPSIIVGDKNFIALHGQGTSYSEADKNKVVFYQDNSSKQTANRIVKPILTEKLKTNTFYHITVVKSAEKCTIYLNGAKQSEGNVKKSAMVNGSYIRIGNAFRQSSNRCLKGKVDEVFIYNRAINTAEIAKLYEGEALEIVLEKAEVVISRKEAARLAKVAKKEAAAKNKEDARLAKIAKQKEEGAEKEIARLAKEKAIVKQEEVEKEKEVVEVVKEKEGKEAARLSKNAKKEAAVKNKEEARLAKIAKQEAEAKEKEAAKIAKGKSEQEVITKQNKGLESLVDLREENRRKANVTNAQGEIEKGKYKFENNMLNKLLKLQTKGKLKPMFYKGYKKGIAKEKMKRFFYGVYGGPFHNGEHQGTQDYYDVETYNGFNNKRMTVPIPFGGSYYLLQEFYLSGKNTTIKLLGHSNPIFTEAVSYGGITTEGVKQLLIEQGEDIKKDVFKSVYHAAFLPMEEFERQKKILHEIAIKECQDWKIKNIDDAIYYAWYYGKGNNRGFEYSEEVIKTGYANIKPQYLPKFIDIFPYSEIMPEVKAKYINSLNSFEPLILAYAKYSDANIDKEEIETKLYGMINNISNIKFFVKVFPNSKHKNELDTRAYKIVSTSNTIPSYEKYLSIFPNGQNKTKAKEGIKEIKRKIEEERQRRIKVRQEKIKKEGADAIYSSYSSREWGFNWGYYDEYSVEFNDYTQGTYYYVEKDGYYCLSTRTGLGGSNKLFYNTEKQTLKALYHYKKTGYLLDEGRYYPPVYTNEDYEKDRLEEEKQEKDKEAIRTMNEMKLKSENTGECIAELEDELVVNESFSTKEDIGYGDCDGFLCNWILTYVPEDRVFKRKGWYIQKTFGDDGPFDTKREAIEALCKERFED